MVSLASSLGVLLVGLGLLSARGQCTYEFQASRTMLALETQTIVNYGGVVLAPGNVMAATFEGIPHPTGGVNISGVSLFVIPAFHAVSSALLEVAVALGTGGDTVITEDADSDADAGSKSAEYDIPRNASHLESGGIVNEWSISDTQSTKGSVAWETCRYYEVGNIQADVQQVISEATFVNHTTQVEVFLRHHSGQTAFIEGNTDNYVRNVVLQIRGSCGWNLSEASTPSSSSSSSSPSNSYWGYIEGLAEEQQGYSSYFGGSPGKRTSQGPIEDGRRHPLCGGEYLDDCDLGPYRSTDVGDGSCQQHLNTEGCHYDGGDCCSITCALESTREKAYNCQESELDRYFCSDPGYSIDLTQQAYGYTSAAKEINPFSRPLLHGRVAGHLASYRVVELGMEMLALWTAVMTIVVASVDRVGLF